jgi:hypothetical protein
MYVRQPSKNIKIPENYHGNAFSPPPISREMPPPIRQSVQERQHIGDLSPAGDLPPGERIRDIEDSVNSESLEEYTAPRRISDEPLSNAPPSETDNDIQIPLVPTRFQKLPEGTESSAPIREKKGGTLFQTLFPPIGRLEEHFPFGHGIGSEELLIMAMMLLVYLSGEDGQTPDNELLSLLGLLLFAG